MDILNFLISYFANGYNEKLAPLFATLKENSFDIKKTLASIDIKTLLPLLKDVLSTLSKSNNNSPIMPALKTEPVEKIADEEIVATLNRYFETDI